MRRAVAVLTIVLLALALAAAGCAPDTSAEATVRVVANDLAFQPAALEVPARRAFVLLLDNRERGIPHNLAIYADESAARALFVGQIIVGPSQITETVPRLAPGRFFYRCDIHPQMTGLLDAW